MDEERRRIRVGATVLGVLAGTLLFAMGLWLISRTAPPADLRDLFEEGLGLPADAYELERVRIGRPLRVTLRDVALLDDRGGVVAEAPAMRFTFRPDPAVPGVSVALDDVVLERPRVYLEEGGDGVWNFERAVRLTVRDEPVEAPQAILLRNVRIEGGELAVVRPRPDDPARFAVLGAPATVGGRSVQRQTVTGLNAVLSEVRIGGEAGWQVAVERLSGRLVEQDIPIRQLAGVFGGTADGGVRFALRELRTDRSVVTGEGDMRLTPEGPAFALSVSAEPLDFADLRWIFPDLPAGQMRTDAVIEGAPGAPMRIALTDLDAEVDGSRVRGRTTVVLQPGAAEPMIRDTDLTLDPVRLILAEQLGLVDALPVLGELRGRVVTTEAATLGDAALRVDLTADLHPRDDPAARSTILAVGGMQVLGADPWVRFDGLRVDFAPLDLRTARALLDDPPDLLRGVLTGGAQLEGSWRDLRLVSGDIAYTVGDAPATRLADLSGRIRQLNGDWAYDLSATAAPLALATITEIVPALPLQPAALSGPISVSGVNERLSIAADVRGEAGALDLRADLVLADPFRFDVRANVDAFRPALIMAQDVPLPVPLTGRIDLAGTAADFTFDVDLRQPEGRAILAGRVQLPADRIEVAGRLEDFRIGALFGQPGLFPAPMSGPIRIVDAAGPRLEVDIHLAGPESLLRVAGWVEPGDVPAYALAGEVLGLDLARIPWAEGLPRSRIAAHFEVEGSGVTAQTFVGRFNIDADGSIIEGDRVRLARARGFAGDGLIQIEELVLAHRDARLEAAGAIGVNRPTPEPLRIDLDARDLGTLVAILPIPGVDETEVSGSLAASIAVGGTLEYPLIEAEVRGRRVRYGGWRANDLTGTVSLRHLATGWEGSVSTLARGARLPGGELFPVFRLDADVRDDQIAFAGFAEREDGVDLSMAAVAEVEGTLLQGLTLESMLLRFGDVRWQLASPASIRWGDTDGLRVDGLALRRYGEVPGLIEIDGQIPETGEADVRIQLTSVDLSDVRVFLPDLPEMEGLLDLQVFIQGPVSAPRADLDLRIAPLRVGEAFADEVVFEGELAGGSLQGSAFVEIAGARVLAGELEMPMDLDIGGFAPSVSIPEEAPIRASLMLANLPIELLAEMAPQLSEGAGFLAGEFDVGGDVTRPQLNGWVRIDEGALRVEPLGLRYSEIDARLALNDRQIEIERFTARSRGMLDLAGVVILEELDRPIFGVTAQLNGFRLFDLPEIGRAAASGELALTGQAPAPVLRGNVVIDEADLTIPAFGDPALARLEDVDVGQVGADTIPGVVREPAIPFFGDLRVDGVEVVVGDDVWLTALDARVQLGGDVIVFRDQDDIRLFGELEVDRGTYTLRIGPIIREFDIERGRIQFTGTPDINPTIDIAAVHEIRNLTAAGAGPGMGSTLRIIVELTGTAEFPQLALTSDSRPPLPEGELISFLIFGRPSFQLSMVGGSLAQDILLQEVVGGVVASQVERFLLRDLGLPLDFLRVHTRPTDFADPIGQAALEAGVRLGRDFFLTTELGFSGIFARETPTWGASLEWEIDDYWSWRVAYEPLRRDYLAEVLPDLVTRQFTTDIRRRWQYGYPEEEIDPAPLDPAEELPEYPGETPQR